MIIAAIKKNFPDDEVVGEEEASTLRENAKLRDLIWNLVDGTKLDDAASEEILGGPLKSVEEMLTAIDEGNSAGGSKGRIWALDPIDGTKGFLRGGQYAVCLALMVDGDVKVGVLGCPNLPVDDSAPLTADVGGGKGVLISAVLGQGANSRPLGTAGLEQSKPIQMKPVKDITQATFCESVEAGHSSHGDQAEIAKKLGITKDSVRMDSQAKYASIARGAGDIYLRLPTSATYVEKIWDHAAGDLIVREAGGVVTDSVGKRLDFSKGRTLVCCDFIVAITCPVQLFLTLFLDRQQRCRCSPRSYSKQRTRDRKGGPGQEVKLHSVSKNPTFPNHTLRTIRLQMPHGICHIVFPTTT